MRGWSALIGIAYLCLTSWASVTVASAASSTFAAAATYYVSPSGDDAAAGTSPTTAWQTIGRVDAQVLNAGDTVMFQGGSTFSGKLYVNPVENGTPAAPITFDSYGTG